MLSSEYVICLTEDYFIRIVDNIIVLMFNNLKCLKCLDCTTSYVWYVFLSFINCPKFEYFRIRIKNNDEKRGNSD